MKKKATPQHWLFEKTTRENHGPLIAEIRLLIHSARNAASFRLSWTHYVELLAIKDPNERHFDEIENRLAAIR